ncbi:hypothetical protein H0H87_011080 [Tephrocybe sp. NHM501043]|nr:hypothetical protein H0H87_011080 [Tephrocybe sp. NHM501043]
MLDPQKITSGITNSIALKMRVGASISEPFVLSTYASSKQLPKSGSGGKKQRGLTNVFATHGKASGSSDGYATVAAQGDGVHVVDISTLHPVISHTLGPSTTFACPAITRNVEDGVDSICTTYAAISTSSDVTLEDSGRTIWMWKDNLSGPLEDRASQKKKAVVIQHQISGLYTCDEIPTRIFAQSLQAELSILDEELNVKNTWPAPKDTSSVIRTFLYSHTLCSFSPSLSTSQTGALLVSVDASKNSTRVRLLSLDDEDRVSELGSSSIPIKPDQILDLSCSPSGFMSFLSRDGTWSSYRLTYKDSTVELSVVSEPLRLTGLTFPSKASTEGASLLSLGSSHVLLSALTASTTPEIVLLLWDLQYSVLLASQALPIPSTLAQAADVTVQLTLVPASSSQVVLILSPHTSDATRKSKGTPSRSSVLVVPFTCPEHSTIANAMGQASSGAKWIERETASSSAGVAPHDPARTKVLSTMKTAMDKNLPQAANVAFFEWEKRESKATAEASTEAGSLQAVLSHGFVRDLLTTVLQPSKPANAPYSSEVVRYLLNRKLLSSSMIDGGLLSALRYKNDWQSIELAFDNVIDLSEGEIIESLQFVVARHRTTVTPQDGNAMEVDSTTDVPSVPTFLSLCVSYTTTPPALRLALRRSLKEAEEILPVLRILENWTKQWTKRDIKLLPSKKEIVKDTHGIPVLKKQTTEGTRDLPSLPNVLSFLQTLLDASFLILLQHAPAHPVLRSIQEQIEPEVSLIDDMEQLRGPLETFAKAHTKAVKEAGQDKRKKPVGDWRQRRKQAHEQAGLSVGLYQLEELVL